MKLTTARGALLLMAFVVFAALLGPTAHGQSAPQAAGQVAQAYAAVLGAERDGGNVTALVAKLNTAVALIQQAEAVNATDPSRAQALFSQASSLAQQVLQAAPGVAAAGRSSVFAGQIELFVETAVLVALAAVAYIFAPRVFWRLWLRTRRDWRVKKA
ncbi:MAG: hypothetical protein KGI26_07355 [Thaumarchaeota archaeon]|nr:hypothetical protein [Nitrososphaerota archaeon]